MGAYLSTPNRDKVSVNYKSEAFDYGASSMQGWRISQEDAHNCCPDFDPENGASLFAVYDGHGGAEVAQYTAQHFPDFLRKTPKYKECAVAQALEDAFLAFDESLTKESVVETLKELAGLDEAEEDEEEQKNEVAGLFEEAEMPIEKLMERYGAGNKSYKKLCDKGDDFQSPALRPKKDSMDKIEADHIKQNMSNKLLNGNHDDKAETECVANGDDEKTLKEKNQNKSSAENVDSTVEIVQSKEEKISDCSDTQKADTKESSQENNVTLPDSTQNESKTGSSPVKDSVVESTTKESTNCTPEVTSSSEGTKQTGESESQTVARESGAGGSSSEATSASSGGGSTASGGSSAASGGSSATSSDDSDVKDEPTSSSGRRRAKRSGVIPAEGEDESSCDEDEEMSDSDEEIDEEDITESDSEDEDMAGFEGIADDDDEEDEEDEDEERGVVLGGEEPGSDSGCTAVVAVLRGKELYVANAGDSRCVVCRQGKAVDMSIDHKPEDELEKKRIERAGGQVTEDNRVNGGLNLSRAIGDHVYKRNADLPLKEQMITALPDVKSLTLTDEDEFMVLACDGIWNVMSSQDVCVFVRDRLKAGVNKISDIIEEMFDFCMAPDTSGDGTGCDNMTCIIVKFPDTPTDSASQSATGAVKRRAEEDNACAESKKTKDGD